MMIKAIETVYNGYRFRSRLEARWAVFFDMLGIKYEYEQEGFEFELKDIGKVKYLPDFYIPKWDKYIEVKPMRTPILSPKEAYKCGGFVQKCEKTLLIVTGEPWPFDYSVMVLTPMYSELDKKSIVAWDINRKVFSIGYTSGEIYLFIIPNREEISPIDFMPLSKEFSAFKNEKDKPQMIWIMMKEEIEQTEEDTLPVLCDLGSMELYVNSIPIEGGVLSNAYTAARQARFENRTN